MLGCLKFKTVFIYRLLAHSLPYCVSTVILLYVSANFGYFSRGLEIFINTIYYVMSHLKAIPIAVFDNRE